MTSFLGEYSAKVDDKGRMVFPSAFKATMGPGADMRLVVKPAVYAGCLEVRTYAEWENEASSVRSRLNLFNRRHDLLWRAFMANTAVVEPDDKVGRILIPKNLLSEKGIKNGTEVVFSGCGDKIEIWAKADFEAQKISGEEFVNLAEEILG